MTPTSETVLNDFVVTLDIDWAPDFMIDAAARILRARQVRATWFVTHASPAIDRLRAADGLFELGVHPNLLPGSTHGASTQEAFDHVLGLVPDAISVRCHAIVQSGPLTEWMLTRTPLKVESNHFLPYMPHIRPVEYERFGRTLLRVPFVWADDYEMGLSRPDWRLAPLAAVDGLKVVLFHPLNIFLNSPNAGPYDAVKRAVGGIDRLTERDAAPHVWRGEGTATLFDALTRRLAGSSGLTLRDVYNRWQADHNVSSRAN